MHDNGTTDRWWVTVRAVVAGLPRRTFGSIVAAVGALVTTASAYLPWYGDSSARELSVRHLVQADVAGQADGYWTSVAAPLAVLGMVGVVGAALRSRLVLGLAWLTGVATVALWGLMRLVDAATGEPAAESGRFGVWAGVTGLVVLLAGIVAMGPRREEVDARLSVFGDPPR